MSMTYHVHIKDGRWVVRKYGGMRALRAFQEREPAVEYARSLFEDGDGIYVYGDSGKVEYVITEREDD